MDAGREEYREEAGAGRRSQKMWAIGRELLPGLSLTLMIALIASLLGRRAPILGAAVIAIGLGTCWRQFVGVSKHYLPGVRFASKRVLQFAVILLGAGLSLRQIWTSGSSSLIVMLGTLAFGVPAMLLLGRLLGIDTTLTRLISVGTGICGASAIGALAPILAAEETTVAYAISTVFLYNIAAVLLFPPIGHLLGLSQHGFGLWAGTAVNDTSSVVATGYSYGAAAGAFAVVVKLTRTVLIVPLSLIFAAVVARERKQGAVGRARRASLPLFILWFLLASALYTSGLFTPIGPHLLPQLGQFLIVVALAGVGLSADLPAMARTGFRPIFLGGAGWILLACLSLLLQHFGGTV